MSYALVISNSIQAEGGLPFSAKIITGPANLLGGVVNDLANQTAGVQQSCGWFAVQDTVRPADTATLTTDRTLTLNGVTPTVTWVSRNQTQAELDITAQQTVRADIESRVAGYITSADTFLALGAPTQAQTLAQVQRNTRAIIGIIRQARAALLVANSDT